MSLSEKIKIWRKDLKYFTRAMIVIVWMALCENTLAAAKECSPSGNFLRPVPVAQAHEITIASQNLEQLFDDVKNGPAKVVNSQTYQWRLKKFADQLVTNLREPDVIAVQEAENADVLQALSRVMTQRGGKKSYQVLHYKGADSGGHHLGYLIRADWKVLTKEPLLANKRINNRAELFDRPSLRVRVRTKEGAVFDIVNVHLKSLYGANNPKKARKIAQKREQQAQELSTWLRARLQRSNEPPLIVLGDFNATPEVIGGVDVLQYMQKTGLKWALDKLPPEERYSFVFRCEPEALDHAYYSAGVKLVSVAFSRGNAGLPKHYAEQYADARRSSDHDGLVLYIAP